MFKKEVWFDLEIHLKEMKKQTPLLSFEKISSIAEQSGITDKKDILDSIRFLNDLGVLQYFEINGLKDIVVIDPQWIVNVVSSNSN